MEWNTKSMSCENIDLPFSLRFVSQVACYFEYMDQTMSVLPYLMPDNEVRIRDSLSVCLILSICCTTKRSQSLSASSRNVRKANPKIISIWRKRTYLYEYNCLHHLFLGISLRHSFGSVKSQFLREWEHSTFCCDNQSADHFVRERLLTHIHCYHAITCGRSGP